jgi:hypothetical protein
VDGIVETGNRGQHLSVGQRLVGSRRVPGRVVADGVPHHFRNLGQHD